MTDRDSISLKIDADTFLAALPVPALVLDANRIVLAANVRARNVLKLMLLGEDLARAIRNPTLLEAVDDALAGGKTVSREIRLGTTPPLIFEASVSVLEFGGAPHLLIALVDQTSAHQVDAVRSAFVANVSHELRSPLTTLMSAAEALEGPAADDPTGRARMLSLMGQEARRMKNLVEDLLSLSRVEAQEFIPPGEQVDLRPLLLGTKDRLSERAAERNVVIKMDIDNDLPKVPGVDEELFQVFDNLISNAIKYGPEGSTVSVGAQVKDQMLRITVNNTGPAIPAEHLPRLTERFYRIDKSRSRELGGTGLGLAIVKHIVNRHRGTLEIESSKDRGTTFSVGLPRSD
jgi:two-component system phosphate regulon sensor histidine kinase PhoR